MTLELNLSSGMRVLSAGVFGYDYLITLPTEYRFYKRQRSFWQLSMPCKLFVATRYLGLAAVSGATFVHFFAGEKHCAHTVPLSGALRVLLSTATVFTLLWRTWNIWGRSRAVLLLMLVALIPVTAFSYSFLFDQAPYVQHGTCTALGGKTVFGKKWVFTLANLIYDILACTLSSVKLIKNIADLPTAPSLSRTLLTQGIGYFVLVVFGHVLNLICLLHADPANQNAFLTFNVALNSILAQRIITSIVKRRPLTTSDTASSSRQPTTTPSIFDVPVLTSTMLHASRVSGPSVSENPVLPEGGGDLKSHEGSSTTTTRVFERKGAVQGTFGAVSEDVTRR